MRPIRAVALALVPALGLLALAGCGDEGSGSGSPTSPAPSSTPTPTPSVVTDPTSAPTTPNTKSPSNTTDPSGEQADVTLDVTIAGGKVSPSGKVIDVALGNKVKITGVSDTHEEIHVHGFDKTLKLDKGKTGSIVFKADRKGSFEVETHETGKLIAKLRVS